jgi:hypothetical protein
MIKEKPKKQRVQIAKKSAKNDDEYTFSARRTELQVQMQQIFMRVPEYEPLHIYCPAVTWCLYIALQVFTVANALQEIAPAIQRDGDKNAFYNWYGWYFFWPTLVWGFYQLYMGMRIDGRMTKEINAANARLLPTERPLEHVPGMPRTPEDHAAEVAANRSHINKFIAFWLCCFPPAIKMSHDHRAEYTWYFILAPMMLYFVYFAVIGYQRGDVNCIDQRDINIQNAAATAATGNDHSADGDADEGSIDDEDVIVDASLIGGSGGASNGSNMTVVNIMKQSREDDIVEIPMKSMQKKTNTNTNTDK